MFAGFVHGYLSAANALSKQTYDLVPWQSDKVMINSIAKVCTKANGLVKSCGVWCNRWRRSA